MVWSEQRISRQLKLRDLHVLMTVARCGSMGKAANQLSVSQPAISKAVADMEAALGVKLLDRNPRGVVPTIYARALLDRGLAAFDELKQGIEQVDFLADPATGELRIGSTIAIATGFLPAVVDRLSRKYPRVVFHLSAGEAAMTYRTLEERTVDVVIAPLFASTAVEHLRTELLYDEPLVVVAGARSVWAKRRKIELAELADAAWTLPPPDSLYGSVVAEAFRANGLDTPSATVFTSVTPARNALLATGRFVSIVQGSVMRFNLDNPAFKVLPIDLPTTRRPIAAIVLKARTLSSVARLFIDCAHEVAKALPRQTKFA
jgi:DNA-binding transcriptional LysR family regulator